MISTLTSLFSSWEFPNCRRTEKRKVADSINDEAQKKLTKVTSNIQPPESSVQGRVVKVQEESSSPSCSLFCEALKQVLDSHQSESGHRIVPGIITLIGDYEGGLGALKPPLDRQFVANIAFAKRMWNDFGDIGEVPPLPTDIYQILASPCPFNKGKTVGETHTLALVPATLKQEPMTLVRLGEEMRKIGKIGYRYSPFLHIYGDTPFKSSHWVLMTKTDIKEAEDKCYGEQKKIVASYLNYQVPKLAQAVVVIFAEYLATGNYRNGTTTKCQEPYEGDQMIVNSMFEGLDVDFDDDDFYPKICPLRVLGD